MQIQIAELERAILVAVEALQHGNRGTYEGNGWPIVLDEGVPKALILAELCRRTDIDFQVAQLDSTLSKMVSLGWLRKEIKDWSYWPDISYKRSDGLMVISRRLHGCPCHEVLLDGQQVVIAEMMEEGSDANGYSEDLTCYQITERGLHILEPVQDASRHGADSSAGPLAPGSEGKNTPRLKPCEEKAYQSYREAESKMNPPPKTDKAAYDWLREQLDQQDYQLPTFDTWQRQVRAGRNHYGQKKNTPRHGRSGRSIVHQSEI